MVREEAGPCMSRAVREGLGALHFEDGDTLAERGDLGHVGEAGLRFHFGDGGENALILSFILFG